MEHQDIVKQEITKDTVVIDANGTQLLNFGGVDSTATLTKGEIEKLIVKFQSLTGYSYSGAVQKLKEVANR